jgi:hypothetical protein
LARPKSLNWFGKIRAEKTLFEEIGNPGSLVEKAVQDAGLEFKNELDNKKYFEFDGSNFKNFP